jgi:hypothetical protein
LKLFKVKRKKEMRHPFDLGKDELQSLDLNSVQDLTDIESESVSGGKSEYSTMAAGGEAGESGGGMMTTMAVGEEGGGWPGHGGSTPWPGNFPWPESWPCSSKPE